MSFYVTLPSNSSLEVFPNNTTTRFSTKMHAPIRLEGSYEVALVEIMYPVSWKNRTDGVIILKYEDVKVEYIVSFPVYGSMSELTSSIANHFKDSEIGLAMTYNAPSQRILIGMMPGVTLVFTNGIENEFGFTKNELKSTDEQSEFISDFVLKDHLNNVNGLYVYSDIVEYQFVGDVYAPLLQVVASNVAKDATYVDKIYDSPHYITVSRNNIDTIEINILTDLGEPISFTKGRVVVKLHFRRKNYYS